MVEKQLNKFKWKRYIIVVLTLFLLFISFTNFFTFQSFLQDSYFRTINPRSGVRQLEQSYKENFNSAESVRVKANFVNDEMKTNAQNSNDLFRYQEKIREFMTKRETHYIEMLRIDDTALTYRLSSDYRVFFEKRKAADQNDYDAFKIYRDSMRQLMDGMLAYSKFIDLYNRAVDVMALLGSPDGFTPENVKNYRELSLTVALQYNEVASLTEKGVFTKELGASLNQRNEGIKLVAGLNDAIVSGNNQRADEILLIMKKRGQPDVSKEVDLIAQWSKEKALPAYQAQDAKHKLSLDLYDQAYTFAKNQKLDLILTIWEGNYPGFSSVEDESPV